MQCNTIQHHLTQHPTTMHQNEMTVNYLSSSQYLSEDQTELLHYYSRDNIENENMLFY